MNTYICIYTHYTYTQLDMNYIIATAMLMLIDTAPDHQSFIFSVVDMVQKECKGGRHHPSRT